MYIYACRCYFILLRKSRHFRQTFGQDQHRQRSRNNTMTPARNSVYRQNRVEEGCCFEPPIETVNCVRFCRIRLGLRELWTALRVIGWKVILSFCFVLFVFSSVAFVFSNTMVKWQRDSAYDTDRMCTDRQSLMLKEKDSKNVLRYTPPSCSVVTFPFSHSATSFCGSSNSYSYSYSHLLLASTHRRELMVKRHERILLLWTHQIL